MTPTRRRPWSAGGGGRPSRAAGRPQSPICRREWRAAARWGCGGGSVARWLVAGASGICAGAPNRIEQTMRNRQCPADQVGLVAARRMLRSGPEDELARLWRGRAGLAQPVGAQRSPAAGMGERSPQPRGNVVLVPPRHERPDRGPQPLPLLGQRILLAAARGGSPRQDLVLDQQVQSLGQHRARDADMIPEVAEPANPLKTPPPPPPGPPPPPTPPRPAPGPLL